MKSQNNISRIHLWLKCYPLIYPIHKTTSINKHIIELHIGRFPITKFKSSECTDWPVFHPWCSAITGGASIARCPTAFQPAAAAVNMVRSLSSTLLLAEGGGCTTAGAVFEGGDVTEWSGNPRTHDEGLLLLVWGICSVYLPEVLHQFVRTDAVGVNSVPVVQASLDVGLP